MKLPHRAMEQHARGRWREALLSLLLLLNPACGRRPGVQPGQVVTSSVALCNLGGGACLPEQEQQVGLLRFNGGLHLTSGNANFGGLSAIRVSAYPPSTSSSAVDTVSHPLQFVAVTDQAMLVTGVLRHDRNGWLTDVDEVSIGHLLDGSGDEISGMDPSTGLDLTDAESLAASSETDPLHGDLLVSFERLHRVLRYQMGNHSNPFDAVPEPVLGLGAHSGRISQCAENGGVEAMELLHSGALLVLCEEPLPIVPADEGPNAVHSAPGWLLPDPSASNTYRVDLLLATDERPVAMARIPRWHGEGRGTSNARVEDGLLVLMRSWSRERGNVLRLLFIDDPVLSAVDLSGVVHQDSRSDRNQVCALDGAVVAGADERTCSPACYCVCVWGREHLAQPVHGCAAPKQKTKLSCSSLFTPTPTLGRCLRVSLAPPPIPTTCS